MINTNYLIVFVLVLALGFALFFPVIQLQSNNSFAKSSWEEHSRCYYFNLETECGRTLYCPTHITKEMCYELKGTWKLETEENDAWQRVYLNYWADNLAHQERLK